MGGSLRKTHPTVHVFGISWSRCTLVNLCKHGQNGTLEAVYISTSRWRLQIVFIFTPDPWRFMIQFDLHIFQMGWFNQQLDYGKNTP